MLTFADEELPRRSVKVSLDTVFLFAETLLRLLEVVRHAVLCKECLRLLRVVFLGRIEERRFEVFLVVLQRLLVDVRLVDTKGHE